MADCPSFFFLSSRRRHTIWPRDWSSDVCSSDLRGWPRPGGSSCAAPQDARPARGPGARSAGGAARSATAAPLAPATPPGTCVVPPSKLPPLVQWTRFGSLRESGGNSPRPHQHVAQLDLRELGGAVKARLMLDRMAPVDAYRHWRRSAREQLELSR